MTTQLTLLQNKIKLMKGEELPDITEKERAELDKMDLTEQLKRARNATYDHYRIKNDNGRKGTFFSDTGIKRSEAASRVITALDQITDELGLRTPAEKLVQDTQLEIMENRNDKEWMRENGKLAVAKMACAKFVVEKMATEEKQAAYIAGDEFAARTEKILKQAPVVKLMGSESQDKVLDRAAKGIDDLVDGINKAMEAPQKAPATAQKTVEVSRQQEKEI